MTDAPPIITNEDAAIDSAFFGSHAGRTCYARAHRRANSLPGSVLHQVRPDQADRCRRSHYYLKRLKYLEASHCGAPFSKLSR